MSGHTPWREIRHKATAASTLEFSVHPWTTLDSDTDAEAVLDSVLDALEADPHALGPALGYDDVTRCVSATFQVEAPNLATAAVVATETFDAALANATDRRTTGLSVVEGGDPERLPWPNQPPEAADR